MAKKRALPDCIDRRHELYGAPKKKPNFEALGEAYFEAGNTNDAIEAFEKVEEPAQRKHLLGKVRAAAIKAGNHFALNRIHNSLPLKPDEWQESAERAKAAGRLLYALSSARRAEHEGLIDELEDMLGLKKPEPVLADPVEGETEGEGEAAESVGETETESEAEAE